MGRNNPRTFQLDCCGIKWNRMTDQKYKICTYNIQLELDIVLYKIKWKLVAVCCNRCISVTMLLFDCFEIFDFI